MSRLLSKKIILGGVFGIFGILLMTGKVRISRVQNVNSFESEPIEISGFNREDVSEDTFPKKIIIPSLDIYLDVKKSRLINGYWEVFENTAGWGEGSGVPGQDGNQVIFAHARDQLFGPLKKIKKDMQIIVLTNDKWYEYKVISIDEVHPGNTEHIKQSKNEIITLYTCSGFQDSKRLLVRAERV